MSRVRKAVIPAAGLGTRFLPATKAQPKEMLPIVDTPVIEYAVREAVASGIDDILIITGRGKRALEDHFDKSIELELHLERNGKSELMSDISCNYGADIHFIRQREPLGLGHAVLQAQKHVGDEPFAVLLADEIYECSAPCLQQLINTYGETGSSVLGLRPVATEEVSRYGIAEGRVTGDRTVKIEKLVEKPLPEETPSRLAVCGRYVLVPEVFDCLRETKPGVNGEIQLTDALQMLLGMQPIYGRLVDATVYDVGDKMGFLTATVDFALKRPDLAPRFRDFLINRMKELGLFDDVLREVASAKGEHGH